MARTVVGLNDPKAVKRYSLDLATDVPKEMYFGPRFISTGKVPTLPVQQLMELESNKGEVINFDLSVQLRGAPVEGSATAKGKEEGLDFYSDSLYIDKVRKGIDCGDSMDQKRTLHDLRKVGKARQSEYWSRLFDEILFIYLSGARGINPDFIYPVGWQGRANNALTAPDSRHLLVAGKKTKATLANTDKFDLALIDRFVAMAGTMGGGSQGVPRIMPIKIAGDSKYVCVMHDWQEYDVRTNATTGQWLDIQKALATSVGAKSPIALGGMGEHNNVVLHKHPNCIRFSDYGSGGNLAAARALFMGVQAAVIAFGSPGAGMRFDWHEEMDDRGERLIITTKAIFGVKKTTFNGLDYGLVAADTYVADPNA
jgi:N4-gp56 family major capsid protein